jgi:hypothetical protein
MEVSQNNLKTSLIKKYDQLLSRILFGNKSQKEGLDDGSMTLAVKDLQKKIKDEIKYDLENSNVFLIQEELGTMRQNTQDDFSKVNQKLSDFELLMDSFMDKLDEQMNEFKTETSKDINNTLKEFQAVDRELKRHQDLFREISGKYFNLAQEKHDLQKSIETRNLYSNHQSKSSVANLPDHKVAIANKRYRSSKSVMNKNVGNTSRPKLCDDFMRVEINVLNKSVLPEISPISKPKFKNYKSTSKLNKSTLNSRANYEINNTLQKVNF